MGWPMWGTLIGLLDGATPVLGIMDQPFTRERYLGRRRRHRTCAWRDGGAEAHQDPRLPAARRGDPVDDASRSFRRWRRSGKLRAAHVAGAHDPLRRRLLRLLPAGGGIRRPHRRGRLEAATTSSPSSRIIESAGGRITTWDGKPATQGGRIVAAGDARLHEQAMAMLYRVERRVRRPSRRRRDRRRRRPRSACARHRSPAGSHAATRASGCRRKPWRARQSPRWRASTRRCRCRRRTSAAER